MRSRKNVIFLARRLYRALFFEPERFGIRFKKLLLIPYRKVLYYLAWALAFKSSKIYNINWFEKRIYSGSGEDGMLEVIFYKIGVVNKFFVEFGYGEGYWNSMFLYKKKGWKGIWLDDVDRKTNDPRVYQEFITAENVNDVFKKYNIPFEFGLLSIDIDGNDYWVWKALGSEYRPKVVVIEYNAKFPPTISKVIEYDPNFKFDGTDYFGASLLAFAKLAKLKGYSLVGCDDNGVNAIFVVDEYADLFYSHDNVEKIYRAPKYGVKKYNFCFPPSNRIMMDI